MRLWQSTVAAWQEWRFHSLRLCLSGNHSMSLGRRIHLIGIGQMTWCEWHLQVATFVGFSKLVPLTIGNGSTLDVPNGNWLHFLRDTTTWDLNLNDDHDYTFLGQDDRLRRFASPESSGEWKHLVNEFTQTWDRWYLSNSDLIHNHDDLSSHNSGLSLAIRVSSGFIYVTVFTRLCPNAIRFSNLPWVPWQMGTMWFSHWVVRLRAGMAWDFMAGNRNELWTPGTM